MYNIYVSYFLSAPIIAKDGSDKQKEAFLRAKIQGITLHRLYANEDFGTCLETWEELKKIFISQTNQTLN